MDFYCIISGRSWWAPSFTSIWKQQLINKLKLANEDEMFSFFLTRWGQFGNVDFVWHPDEFEAWDRFDFWISEEIRLGWTESGGADACREIWILLAGHNPFIPSAHKPDCCPLNDYKRTKRPGLSRDTALNSLRAGRWSLNLVYNWAEKIIVDHPWPNRS